MIEMAALGLTTWQMFACMRVMWWGTASPTSIEDKLTCGMMETTLLEKQCKAEREQDWQAYCGNLYYSGFAIDCQNANPLEKGAISNRLAKSTQSEQWKCLHGNT